MNKNKISPELLKNVSILNCDLNNVLIYSNNFNLTKKYLNENNFVYTPYRFAKCFYLQTNFENLKLLSMQNDVNYIFSNTIVQSLSNAVKFINLNSLTENKFFGKGQTICFIDTGIFPHLDFVFPKNRIIKFVDLINNKSYAYDDNGHGTFVCGVGCGGGILNNTNSGFAKHANIICIKALDKSGSSNSNKILDAMEWIFQNHKVYNIGVVCMSFGAEPLLDLDPLGKGAESLWRAGIVVVAAAGNSGPNNETIKSPGNNPYIITVGALDTNSMSTADFSSRGPTIYGYKPDLIAPAVDLLSCNNTYLPYTTMSGTSVATPIIAGICAIIKQKFPKMSNNEIKYFLLKHCRKITGNKNIEGCGYIKF